VQTSDQAADALFSLEVVLISRHNACLDSRVSTRDFP